MFLQQMLKIFIILLEIHTIFTYQCKNENNEDVDWFAVYKLPKLKNSNKLIENGLCYLYLTPSIPQWSVSQIPINSSNSIIGNTLSPLFLNKNISSFVIYNDQPPTEPDKNNKGHTKGVILLDLEAGLWLIHSVPHFPDITQTSYKFSTTGVLKGQSFLCISLDLRNLNKVGVQLQYNNPQIYSSQILEALEGKINKIVEAVKGVTVNEPPWYNKIIINSRNGVKFTSFAKGGKFGKDLYEDWVAPSLGDDLLTETWLNGEGRLPSNCTKKFKVYNIETLKVNDISFKDSEDHSKWAVSAHLPWLCIGDINRMSHQKVRGGGTVCQNNPILAKIYRDSITTIEKCN